MPKPKIQEAMSIMAAAVLNELSLTRRLMAAAFTAEQAEGPAGALASDVVTDLATKTDLRELGEKLTVRPGGAVAVMLSLAVAAIKLF